MHLVGFVYIIRYDARYTQRQNLCFVKVGGRAPRVTYRPVTMPFLSQDREFSRQKAVPLLSFQPLHSKPEGKDRKLARH